MHGSGPSHLLTGSNWDDPPSCNLNRALYFQKMTSTKLKLNSFERQIYEQVAVDEFTPMETTARSWRDYDRGNVYARHPGGWRGILKGYLQFAC